MCAYLRTHVPICYVKGAMFTSMDSASQPPVRIIWLSQHKPTPRQREELARIALNHLLFIDPKPFANAEDIVNRFHAANGDYLVLVAPWPLVRELGKRAIPMLYAEMQKCSPEEAEVTLGTGVRPRYYRHSKFHHCRGASLDLREIVEPLGAWKK